jgi:hypothetical protein
MNDQVAAFADALPGMIWTAGADGRLAFVNRCWCEYTGIRVDEAATRGAQSVIHPEDLQATLARWRSLVAAGEPGELEARLRRHDGSYRWFRIAVNPMRGAGSRVVSWCGINTEIDDRSAARPPDAAALIESIPMMGWATRADGYMEFANRRWLEYAGVTADQVAGWGWQVVIHPDDLQGLVEYWKYCLATGTTTPTEARMRRFDGAYRWFLFLGNPVRDAAGKIVQWFGTNVDIEDRKRAEEGLRERRTSEDALTRTRSELAYMTRVASMGALTASIAHEVNQPLQGIITNASVCQRMLAAEPPNIEGALETSRRIHRDGHRATDVIARLRALFGKRHRATESVDLNQAIREVIALSMSEMQRNRVTVRVELGEDLPRIVGDRVQLQQVILNLIMNASGAMSAVDDRPRLIMVTSAADGAEAVHVSVEDTGVGIGAADSEKVFDAFYTTKADGMGIGLSVSRSIIETHGGRLWARPNDGPGATFAFVLPVKTETSAGTQT